MSTLFPGDWIRIPEAIVSVALCAAVLMSLAPSFAQGGDDATPVRANLVTPTPEGAQALAPTITPSFTPTPLPAARLQALQSAGNVNVRALPDIESELLGAIAHGALYPVLRNYYRWYELSFELSPTGRAWVYGDLVTIEGDPSQIEVIDNLDDVISPGSVTLSGDESADLPGANPRTIEIATVEADAASIVEVIEATPLPTYTPPATQPSFVHQLERVESSDPRLLELPPLVPILALAGLGFVGLIISLLRS